MAIVIPTRLNVYTLSPQRTVVNAVIKNESDRTITVYVGCTLASGIGGSGCDLYATGTYYDLQIRTVSLSPGGTTTVSWTREGALAEGTWYAIVKVWLSPAPATCLAGSYTSFRVVGLPRVSIVSITASYQ